MFINLCLAKELNKQQDEFKKDISAWLQPKGIEKSEEQFQIIKKKFEKAPRISKEKSKAIANYLDFYYQRRKMIAKCYTKQDFSAGSCSTQRAESLNSIVKKFLKITRRSSFLKLIDCFEYINNHENFQKINSSRIAKSKVLQTEDPLFISLSRNYSPFILSKINEQLAK